MRPPLHLGDRKVDDGEVEQTPLSASSRAHCRELNLERCAAIRRTMDEQTGQPVAELIVPEHGPPSAIIPTEFVPDQVEYDVTNWDRQARDGATGKYLRTRRK